MQGPAHETSCQWCQGEAEHCDAAGDVVGPADRIMIVVTTLATNAAATGPRCDSMLTTPGRKKGITDFFDWFFFTHNLLFAAVNAAEGHVWCLGQVRARGSNLLVVVITDADLPFILQYAAWEPQCSIQHISHLQQNPEFQVCKWDLPMNPSICTVFQVYRLLSAICQWTCLHSISSLYIGH